jgi:hypothetical protein
VAINVAYIVPTVTASATTLGYTEKNPPTPVDSGLTLTAGTLANLTGATVQISANYANGQDVLAFSNQLGITGSWNAASGTLTLSGSASVANYQTALRSVTYVNTSANLSALNRTLTFSIDDAVSIQSATRQLSVAPVDDVPVNALPAAQSILAGTALSFSAGNALSVSDVDANGAIEKITLRVTNGALTLGSVTGLATHSGNGTGNVVITGTLTNLNNALKSLVYTPASGYAGPVTLTMVSDDLGNSGAITAGTSASSVLSMDVVPQAVPAPVSAPIPVPAPALVVSPAASAASASGAPAVARPAPIVVPGAGIAVPVVLTVETPKPYIKGLVREPPTLSPTLNHYEPAGPIQVSLELAPAQTQLSFGPLTPPEWTAQFAFPDEGGGGGQKDQIKILLEQVQLGGLALSVGVVWWASRISGLLGSLLASAPAWRNIDPLPVLGRDEEQERDKGWFEGEDLERDADELAMSLMLEGGGQRARAD